MEVQRRWLYAVVICHSDVRRYVDIRNFQVYLQSDIENKLNLSL